MRDLSMTTDLEKRVARLESEAALWRDELAITRLIASYGPTVDSTVDETATRRVVELWAEDGVYDIAGYGELAGRQAIASVFGQDHYELVGAGIAHLMGVPVVAVSGDTAIALNHSVVFYRGEHGFEPRRVGINRWELARTEGRWSVTRRINRLLDGSEDAIGLAAQIASIAGAGA
jgi:hypothetical protein